MENRKLMELLTGEEDIKEMDRQTLHEMMTIECCEDSEDRAYFLEAIALANWLHVQPACTMLSVFLSELHANSYTTLPVEQLIRLRERLEWMYEGIDFKYDAACFIWSAFTANSTTEYLRESWAFQCSESQWDEDEINRFFMAGIINEDDRMEYLENLKNQKETCVGY